MDRLRVALRLMPAFALCVGAAILLAGTRPASDPGLRIARTVVGERR